MWTYAHSAVSDAWKQPAKPYRTLDHVGLSSTNYSKLPEYRSNAAVAVTHKRSL